MARGSSLVKKNIRKFVLHTAKDEDLFARAALRGREITTIGFLYRETDMTAAEICYMFSLPDNSLANWRKRNRWKKEGGSRISMSKERLEDLIVRGSHHLVPPKRESELDIRKKYNHIGYVCGLKLDEMLKSNIVSSTEVNNVKNILSISREAYKLQMDASGYIASTKDIRELEAKHRGMDIKEKEMELKSEGGKFIFDTVEKFDSPLGMSKGENLRLIHETLQAFLGNEKANELTEVMNEELSKFMPNDVKEVEYVKTDNELDNGRNSNEPRKSRRGRKPQ